MGAMAEASGSLVCPLSCPDLGDLFQQTPPCASPLGLLWRQVRARGMVSDQLFLLFLLVCCFSYGAGSICLVQLDDLEQ